MLKDRMKAPLFAAALAIGAAGVVAGPAMAQTSDKATSTGDREHGKDREQMDKARQDAPAAAGSSMGGEAADKSGARSRNGDAATDSGPKKQGAPMTPAPKTPAPTQNQ
ncbi:hypothetical protein GCM10008171_33920 [Methylopila jiangsuensis]|uniref:Uncharacterized protein n=1 Tax=Methylopila jiangsuensis TaxID=586230 RepID=A0A9W6JL23_9HYPH|nr:hypothetical protein [Methylopila jiangsuensis]MDR6284475.1 hypothetical protein [Methylopila jiangsuensis]GLK78138.1 hypothetical protein GCM10008171_33920 [Methylopila jiangsuensis]